MKYLGTYESEVKTAQYYDFVCRILGRTRRLNFPLTQSLPKFNIPDWIQSIVFFRELEGGLPCFPGDIYKKFQKKYFRHSHSNQINSLR